MSDSLADLCHALLDAARTAGADAADSLAVSSDGLSMEIRNGALEQAERSEGIEIGLRVLIGRRQACVSASDTRPETLAIMAERAVAMAREAPEDPYCGLADPAQLASDWDIAALDLADPSPEPAAESLAEDARRAEAAALAVTGITQVSASGAGYGRSDMHVAATNGFSGGYARTMRSTSCVAIAGEGLKMERDHASESRIHAADLPPPEEIGEKAGQRAVARFGASKPKTGAYPVLFDERVSSSLIGHLAGAINGAAIARGSSWLKDAMGEQILPESLTLTEDPLRPRTPGSRPFDAEGLPVTRRAIVERGVLKSWTLDLANARKLGLSSTGNARRGTSAPPAPGLSNLDLTQGAQSRDELMAEMGTGLLVTSMIGSTINPNTGDYSRGASGFWVENGQIVRPVNECTIAGNLREMLRTLRPANDARTWLSTVVPSLLVEGLTLAGD